MKFILLSIGSIALGCYSIWSTFKHSARKEYDFTLVNAKGYIGGVGLIIIGLLTLLGYLKW